MQTLLNILTVFAFIMSTLTWIIGGLSRSVRISLEILDYRTYQKSCKVYVRISNNSSFPIIVQSISIIDERGEHFCYLQPKLSRHEGSLDFYTAEFPLNFSPVQGRQEYIEFRDFPDSEPIQLVEGKTVEFRIYTNRWAIKRAETLGKESHYLHIRK